MGFILCFGIFFISSSAEAKEIIRVLILKDVSQVKVSGQQLALRDMKTGQTVLKKAGFSSLTIEREAASRLKVRGRPISAQGFLLTSSRGPAAINGRWYRHKLKIIPGPNRDLRVINELPLEDYLVGLINYEISSQWPLEAVKAQAVVARSYAIFQKRNRAGELHDVESTVSDQVYGGVGEEDLRSRQAVKETKGETLFYRGSPIFAVYHACCGGKTEMPHHLWAGNFPYLKNIICNSCLDSPHFLWNHHTDSLSLAKALERKGFMNSRVMGIEVTERSESGRVLRMSIKGEKDEMDISGKEFRRLLGYDLLRSTNFWVEERDHFYSFSGLGWGHGVGLCQWGAKGMAEKGMDYRAILAHYYQDVELKRIF